MGSSDLSTLDLVCRVMDTRLRPLDFSLILHFVKLPDVRSLTRGELSSRNLYPSTGSWLNGKEWLRPDALQSSLSVRQSGDGGPPGSVQEFLRLPFRLQREVPVRQLLIHDGVTGPARLFTRVHHAAGDLLSTLMWVCHQLRVATGREPFVGEMAPFEPPALRHQHRGVRKSPSAYRGRCDPIWTRSAPPSATRKWKTLRIRASDFCELSQSRDGFTYNDLLLTCALETLHWWNVQHGVNGRKLGVWIPVNIRREAFSGFGNGTSRIRVYRRFPESASLRMKCHEVRRQVDWSKQNGEWSVPEQSILTRWPLLLSAPILKAFLKRPWADMGSAAFSHVEKWPDRIESELEDVVKMEVIGALHIRHALMLAAVTHRDRTWMTLTYDPSQLWEEDVESIGQFLEHRLSCAAREV
jgi:hypothetical protein